MKTLAQQIERLINNDVSATAHKGLELNGQPAIEARAIVLKDGSVLEYVNGKWGACPYLYYTPSTERRHKGGSVSHRQLTSI